MTTTFLSERLMKAAETLIHHGQQVEVYDMTRWQKCLLLGAGEAPRTVRVGVWCESGEFEAGLSFADCRIPADTLLRLEEIASEQQPERARADAFIARARQRGRDGRYSDGLHGAERAGR
jgi:hypothetical protein